MDSQEISALDRNVFELLCVSLYTDYESDLYKKFQVASPQHVHSEYQVWSAYCYLFLSYADNRHRTAVAQWIKHCANHLRVQVGGVRFLSKPWMYLLLSCVVINFHCAICPLIDDDLQADLEVNHTSRIICVSEIKSNKKNNRHTETHTHTHTHRPAAKNLIFGFRGPQNV